MKKLKVAAFVWVLLALGQSTAVFAGEATRYDLVPRSTVLQFCISCPEPVGRPEVLTGSFALTPVNLTDGAQIDALTDVRLESNSYKITGSGFLHVDRRGRRMVEMLATVNGEEMRLRATRYQPGDGTLSLVLATPRGSEVGYLLVITARPAVVAASDADLDAVGEEADNCPAVANAEQTDADGDGVGDACDRCDATPGGVLVNTEGCSVEQRCPCDSPLGGGVWVRGAYAKCVARSLRDLRRLGLLSRRDAGGMMRRALQSGCGQTVIASL